MRRSVISQGSGCIICNTIFDKRSFFLTGLQDLQDLQDFETPLHPINPAILSKKLRMSAPSCKSYYPVKKIKPVGYQAGCATSAFRRSRSDLF